ncbi:MAG TPA: Yip1 family protein [Gaiellaceae bacterium]|nr:Yip1 family protein [Gaiellaceae bacterium]
MRDWWLRALLVLQRPRPVFVALRDDSKESVSDRAEPVLAIVLLAGIAAVLSTKTAGTLMDDGSYDPLLVAVWTFLAGGIYGVFGYFAFGALLQGGVKALGSQGSYRRSRHVLAFAAAPVALSLVLWHVKLAVYGEALFRTGGTDHGTGIRIFDALQIAFLLWAAVLLLAGVRAVHGWTWARAAAACALAIAVPVLLGLALAR